MTRIRVIAVAAVLLTGLAACSTEKVVDRTVDTSLFAGRTVVKTGVGAGKLAVRGTGAAVRGLTGAEAN